jgi:hypothetical protein
MKYTNKRKQSIECILQASTNRRPGRKGKANMPCALQQMKKSLISPCLAEEQKYFILSM